MCSSDWLRRLLVMQYVSGSTTNVRWIAINLQQATDYVPKKTINFIIPIAAKYSEFSFIQLDLIVL